MYPLNVTSASGYAVANDADEHKRLTELGYGPAFESDADELEELRARAKELGIEVDKRWGEKRLHEEIAKAEK